MNRTLLAAAATLVAAAACAEPVEPLKSGMTETVEVRLVTLDVTVLDREERPVAGLAREDFDLEIGGRPVEITAVDALCSPQRRDGADRVPAMTPPAPSPPEAAAPVFRRRIVIALDYPHLLTPHRRDRGAYLAALLHRLEGEFGGAGPLDVDVMIVALAGGVRIEQSFTRDPQTLVRAIGRIREDASLFGGQYGHLTERRFFADLTSLMTTLSKVPGPKAVVLYSAGNEPDTIRYDDDFRDLAAHSADARAAIYTVDSEGLKHMELSRSRDPVGGAPGLARLAVDTGGRMTRNANDLEIGFQRAVTDSACRYTISFRERGKVPEKPQSVSVRVRRDGLRPLYPAWIR